MGSTTWIATTGSTRSRTRRRDCTWGSASGRWGTTGTSRRRSSAVITAGRRATSYAKRRSRRRSSCRSPRGVGGPRAGPGSMGGPIRYVSRTPRHPPSLWGGKRDTHRPRRFDTLERSRTHPEGGVLVYEDLVFYLAGPGSEFAQPGHRRWMGYNLFFPGHGRRWLPTWPLRLPVDVLLGGYGWWTPGPVCQRAEKEGRRGVLGWNFRGCLFPRR